MKPICGAPRVWPKRAGTLDSRLRGNDEIKNYQFKIIMNLRILILEDHTADSALMELELRQAAIAFDSKRMETLEALLQALHDWSPDVILADYSLPRFNAMKAIALVKQETPLIPVIVVTGTINEETAVECMKAGAVDYVLKDSLLRLGPSVQTAMEAKQAKVEILAAKKSAGRFP